MSGKIIATIRWVDERNAHSLGYFGPGYRAGTWVLEGVGDQWLTDLGDLEDAASVKHAAEAWLNLAEGTWRALPNNYGTALELVGYVHDSVRELSDRRA